MGIHGDDVDSNAKENLARHKKDLEKLSEAKKSLAACTEALAKVQSQIKELTGKLTGKERDDSGLAQRSVAEYEQIKKALAKASASL
ncbi:MAG: hypothetical protein SGJ19_10180 [Planctomycetia bacterium]|nr:hypothetical protein [Planctomycetia bacterium]